MTEFTVFLLIYGAETRLRRLLEFEPNKVRSTSSSSPVKPRVRSPFLVDYGSELHAKTTKLDLCI
jgi:hypothetical protein